MLLFISFFLVTFFLLLLLSSLDGVANAILYSGRSVNAFKWNEHIILVLSRGSWLLLAVSGKFLEPIAFVFLALAFFLAFSFWHNGFYYMAKNKILNPSARFWSFKHFKQDHSETDSSNIHFDFASRSWMFCGALILMLIGIIVLYY